MSFVLLSVKRKLVRMFVNGQQVTLLNCGWCVRGDLGVPYQVLSEFADFGGDHIECQS